jgi:dGTPase
MSVRIYRRLPVQTYFPGLEPDTLRGLKLAREKLKVLDGELCDVATRDTRGRLHNAFEEDDLRTPFERDVQRAEASLIFLRETGKTQVFPMPNDLAVRNRYTHSREVARLSRSMATTLRLNPDLAEAMGLGHDLGHSPFGHAGEAVLNRIRHRVLGLFHKHNIQSLILIDDIYTNRDSGMPIDPTFETRDGVICHLGETKEREIIPWGGLEGEAPKDLSLEELKKGNVKVLEDHRMFFPSTLEGCVVRFADRFSSVARDPEDAVRHKIITWESLPEICLKVFRGKNGSVNASSIIKTLVESLVENSWDETHHTIYSLKLGDRESEALNALYDFNMEKIYRHPRVIDEFLGFIPYIIEGIFLNYTIDADNPRGKIMSPQEAINAISYMTDKEAVDEIRRIKNSKFDLKPIV